MGAFALALVVVALCLAHPGRASAGGFGSGHSPLGNLIGAAGAAVDAAVTTPAAGASSNGTSPSDTLVGSVTQPVAATVAAVTGTDAGTAVTGTEQALATTVDQVAGEAVPHVTSLLRATADVPVVAALLHPSAHDGKPTRSESGPPGTGRPRPALKHAPSSHAEPAGGPTGGGGAPAATQPHAATDDARASVAPAAEVRGAAHYRIGAAAHAVAPALGTAVVSKKHAARAAGTTPAVAAAGLDLPPLAAGPAPAHVASAREEHVSPRSSWGSVGDGTGGADDSTTPRFRHQQAVTSLSITFEAPALDRRAPMSQRIPDAQPAARIPTPPG